MFEDDILNLALSGSDKRLLSGTAQSALMEWDVFWVNRSSA
jgi:hypothetical protein